MLLLIATASALELTHAEVAQHDSEDDCWMVIDGSVYDVTPWVEAHPGGDALLRGCGKDASGFFERRDEGGTAHSAAARAMLPTYKLGDIGDDVTLSTEPVDAPHPHSTRVEGSKVGLLPSSGVGPKRSVAMRVAHNFSTDRDTVGNGMVASVGYSFGFLDVLLTDVRDPGIGGLEFKARPLYQHGSRPMPVSLSVGGGGGFASVAGAPALYGQVVVERDLLDQRLAFRANGTGAMSPGVDDSTRASAGLGMEFRPIPIHGLFGEVQVPFADPSVVAWSAGARIYTRGHTFAVYAASTPMSSAWELAGPTTKQLAIGASFERAFRL
jgi:hypothetical protein